MEITKYLCEFFFTDYKHWLGLVIFVTVLIPRTIVNITKTYKTVQDKDKEKEKDNE